MFPVSLLLFVSAKATAIGNWLPLQATKKKKKNLANENENENEADAGVGMGFCYVDIHVGVDVGEFDSMIRQTSA